MRDWRKLECFAEDFYICTVLNWRRRSLVSIFALKTENLVRKVITYYTWVLGRKNVAQLEKTKVYFKIVLNSCNLFRDISYFLRILMNWTVGWTIPIPYPRDHPSQNEHNIATRSHECRNVIKFLVVIFYTYLVLP